MNTDIIKLKKCRKGVEFFHIQKETKIKYSVDGDLVFESNNGALSIIHKKYLEENGLYYQNGLYIKVIAVNDYDIYFGCL